MMSKSATYLAKDVLGKKFEQYRQIDENNFYDYDNSRNLAIAKILYRHNEDAINFMSARAKFVGNGRIIDFRGYWKGENPEDFWNFWQV